MLFPLDQARDVLFFYRDFCGTLPDEAETYLWAPDGPQGMPVIALILGYNGPIARARKVLHPLEGSESRSLISSDRSVRRTSEDAGRPEHNARLTVWRSAFTNRFRTS